MSFNYGCFALRHVMCMFFALLLSTILNAAEAVSPVAKSPDERRHPFLLVTREGLARTRAAITANPQISALADVLVERSRSAKPEDLPPLERKWWDELKSRPWAETYGPIWHHTGVVPLTWTRMAQDKARAAVLVGDESLAQQAKSILLNLADYSFEFEHYDVGMNYTLWCLEALDAYDVIYDRFQPAEHRKMQDFFGRGVEGDHQVR